MLSWSPLVTSSMFPLSLLFINVSNNGAYIHAGGKEVMVIAEERKACVKYGTIPSGCNQEICTEVCKRVYSSAANGICLDATICACIYPC